MAVVSADAKAKEAELRMETASASLEASSFMRCNETDTCDCRVCQHHLRPALICAQRLPKCNLAHYIVISHLAACFPGNRPRSGHGMLDSASCYSKGVLPGMATGSQTAPPSLHKILLVSVLYRSNWLYLFRDIRGKRGARAVQCGVHWLTSRSTQGYLYIVQCLKVVNPIPEMPMVR
jgi:hypothetical protein